MISFRVGEDEAAEAQEWADRLGVDRSALLSEALHRHLVTLRSEREGDHFVQLPATESALALSEIAAWGPAENWADWATLRTMRRGEIWFAAAPGGNRPVLVLTRDPVADRIWAVTVAALTRTKPDLVSELELTAERDRVPSDCIVNFDNIHTIPRRAVPAKGDDSLRHTHRRGLTRAARLRRLLKYLLGVTHEEVDRGAVERLRILVQAGVGEMFKDGQLAARDRARNRFGEARGRDEVVGAVGH